MRHNHWGTGSLEQWIDAVIQEADENPAWERTIASIPRGRIEHVNGDEIATIVRLWDEKLRDDKLRLQRGFDSQLKTLVIRRRK